MFKGEKNHVYPVKWITKYRDIKIAEATKNFEFGSRIQHLEELSTSAQHEYHRLSQTMNDAPTGICRISLETGTPKIVDASWYAAIILRTGMSNLYGKNFAEFILPETEPQNIYHKIIMGSQRTLPIDIPTINPSQWLQIDAQRTGHQTIIVFHDITARRKAESQLIEDNTHDKLTGLYNRRYFDEFITKLQTDRRLPITIIMADVDKLKYMNDTFGHTVGDNVIKNAAKILKEGFRDDAMIFRVGGDEFVIIVHINEAEANMHISKINKVCDQTILHNGRHLSISIGAATKTSAIQNISSILDVADARMYAVKREK